MRAPGIKCEIRSISFRVHISLGFPGQVWYQTDLGTSKSSPHRAILPDRDGGSAQFPPCFRSSCTQTANRSGAGWSLTSMPCVAVCVQVTGVGGSVAVIRLSGPHAVDIVAKMFRVGRETRSGDARWQPESHRVDYGRVVDVTDGDKTVDEVRARWHVLSLPSHSHPHPAPSPSPSRIRTCEGSGFSSAHAQATLVHCGGRGRGAYPWGGGVQYTGVASVLGGRGTVSTAG